MQCNMWHFKELGFWVTVFINCSKLVLVKCCQKKVQKHFGKMLQKHKKLTHTWESTNTSESLNPKFAVDLCFSKRHPGIQSPHTNVSGIVITDIFLLVNSQLFWKQEFRAHLSQIIKCQQHLENHSSERQEWGSYNRGFRSRTWRCLHPKPLEVPRGAHAAQWIPAWHHQQPNLCLPSEMPPSLQSAAYLLSNTDSFHTCLDKVHAGQLLLMLCKLKF